MKQQGRQIVRSVQQTNLNRKLLTVKTVVTNSEVSSSSNLNFLNNHKDTINNAKIMDKIIPNFNIHRLSVNSFAIIVKQIQVKLIKDSFYKLIAFRNQQNIKYHVTNLLSSIIKSKITLHKTFALNKLKNTIFVQNNHKNFLNVLSIIYKRKYKQNLTYSVKKLKQHVAAAKIQDLSQMKNKIKMSLSKNSQSKKSLQSIVQIVFPQSPKNGNLSPRQIQKQIQFNKFIQSLQQNRAQKNYTQLKINIGNLTRRFGKQQKYIQKVNDYNNMNQMINQIQKYQLISKQSNNFIQKLSTIDLQDIHNSILNTKGIRKQISTTKSRFLKKQEQNHQTIKLLSNIQKINQNFNLLLEAKIAKNQQKNKVQTQLQQKIASMMRNQAQLKKSISNYEENQKYLKSLLQKSINFQEFLKQLDQSRKHKKRAEIPHILLIKISDYFTNHKKYLTQLNMILKTQTSLYQRKNLSQESFNAQLQKLSEKYQQNQYFSSIQQNLNFLIINVQQKQKFVLQAQMKKLKFENQKLNKYMEGEKLKINLLTEELNKHKNNQKLYEIPQKIQPQHTNLQFEQLSTNLKISKQNIAKLESQLKQWKKSILDHQLADEILIKVIQKMEKNQQTWMKDVQSLKKGKNDKYEVVLKVIEYIQKINEQNQRIKVHNVSQMESNLLDQSFLVNKDMQEMNSIIRKVLSNNGDLSFVSSITNPNLANLAILLQSYMYNMELVKNFAKERELLEDKIFQKDQNNQNQQHILRFISKCQEQIPKREYLSTDQCWNSRLSSYEHPNSVHPQIIKLLKKLSKEFRNILIQNRQSQIKQHQNYKEEIKNLSDSLKLLQIDMKEKQLKYQQELFMYQRNQEISARKSLQSVASKKSIKSVRSSTSQNKRSLNQQNQKYKQIIQQYAKDEKLMLQKLNNLTDETQKLKYQIRKYENSLRQARLKLDQLQIELTQKNRQISITKENNSLQNTELKQKVKRLQKIISASPTSQDKQQLIYFKQAYSILLQKYQQKSGFGNIQQCDEEIKLIHDQIQERVKKSYQQTYQKLKKQNEQIQAQKQNILIKYHQDVILIQKQLSEQTHNLKIQLEQYRAQTIQRAEYQLLLGQIQKRDQLIQELNKQILFLNKKLDYSQQQFKLNKKYNSSIDTSQDMDNNFNNQSIENSQNIRHITENTYVVTHSSSGSNLNTREISELEQLRMRLRQAEEQKVSQIQHEVIRALQHQEMEFNQFLAKNNQERELYYENVIIPERIKLWEHEYLQTHPTTIMSVTNTTTTLHENQIQLIVNQKYQQWKHTYLVAYLQQAKKKWLAQFQQNQLQLIINQKMSEWQSVRLFAIIKEKRNEWIVQKLVEEREAQWKRQKQLEIAAKIRQIQNHWETILLPDRIKQWQRTHQTVVTHTTQNTFTQVQLQKIIAEEHLKWQHTFQLELQGKILQVEKYWQFNILPQKKRQWEIKASQTHSTQSQVSVNVEQIINAKYEEWKHTYLVQYLKLAKLKWLQEFKTTQLQLIIQQKYAQWQGVRLLSIIRDAKHAWILQSILKEKRFQWERQKQKQWTLKLRQVEVYYENQILPQKEKQWKLHYEQQYQILLQKQTKPPVDIQVEIKKKQLQWQRLKELQIQARIIQVEHYWQNVILPDNRKQWQSEFILVYQRQHPVQPQNIDYQALINQKYEEWKHTYLVQYLKLQKLKWLEQFKNKELQEILKAKFAQWQSVRLWSIVTQQRNKWIIDKLLNQYRIQWEKTKEHEWSLRIIQIQQFWQSQLAKNRRQWELSSGNRVNEVIHQEERKIELIVNQRIEQWRNTYLTNILNQKHQQWHAHFINIELQKILNEKHEEWHSHFIRVELPKIISQKQAQWTRLKEEQYNIRLSKSINQERLRIESIQSQQLTAVSNEADKNQIVRLKRILQSKSQEINQFEKQFKNWQKLKLENVTLKENLYRLENDNLRQLNQLKIKYQSTISEINHERSMLSMQIKELELNLSKKSKDHQSPNLVSLEKQIITLEATCKSKDSQILFLKRSLDTSSHQNQQMQTKITSLNSKIHTIQGQIQQARNQSIKFEYELKYWKQKEQSMNKKIQSKQNELNQLKNRFEFEKSQLQKRIRQLSVNSQNQSTFQIKISELQSQISIKTNNIKSLQNQLQRRKRDVQEEKLKYQNLIKQIQIYKNSLRQHEGIIQQHKLQTRKYYEEVQKLKSYIQVFQSKQKSYNQQIRKLQSKPAQNNELQDFIRQNQRLRVQIFRLKQKILYMENQQSRQIANLKETISVFEHRLKYQYVQKQDYTQLQILKRINSQISELVSANKQLQLRIIVLENEKNLTSFGLNISRFFESFQEQLDNLINYLVSNEIFKPDANTVYNKFTLRSREALSHGYIQDYFRQWQSFMRSLLQDNSRHLVKQLQDQRQQISDIKRTSTNIKVTDGIIADDSQQIIQKYDMILNDAKFLLKQYIQSNDRAYVKLMATSLGLDEVQVKE